MVKNKIAGLQKNIGRNIRKIRKAHKYSIDELSDILNLSTNFLRCVEMGVRRLSLDNMVYFMELFNVKFEELICDESSDFNNKDPLSGQLMFLASKLSNNEQSFLVHTLKSYLKTKTENQLKATRIY